MKKRKRIIACIGALAVLLCSCGNTTEETVEIPELLEPVGVNVDTAAVERGPLANLVSYGAYVKPATEELYFTVGGTISRFIAYRGQYVEKGDPLIELDHTAVYTQIDNLEKQLADMDKSAEFTDRTAELNIQYKRIELTEIAERMGSGNDQYMMKLLEIEQAEQQQAQAVENREATKTALTAQLEELQKTVEAQTLYAPVAGHFYCDDSVTEGTTIRANRTTAYIIDPNNVMLVVADESVADSILNNGSAYGYLDGARWELEYVPLSKEERTSYVMARQVPPTSFKILGDPLKNGIKAGDYGAVIGETSRLDDCLYVPVKALFHDAAGSFVYVMDGTNREKRYITIGRSNNLVTEIKEGVEEGEQVYVQE